MEETSVAPAPEEAASVPVTKPVSEEPAQDNPEPEPISNGNGTVDHDAEKPAEEEPVEKMDTDEPEKADDTGKSEDEPPKENDAQLASSDEKKEPDSFDKMLEDDKKEDDATPAEEPSEEAKPETDEKPKEDPDAKDDEGKESTETKETPDETKIDKEESETTVKDDDKEEEKDSFDKMLSGESEDKKESDASEEKKDEAKDSFDKMLDGESEEKKEEPKDSFDKMLDGEPEEKKSTDESEEKKDSAEPATTIDADALDETVEKMDEPEKMDTDEPKVVEIISDKVPSDEKYYENLNAEEKEFLENDENLPTVDSICTKLVCSVCSKNLEPVFGLPKSVYRHPHLGIPVCRDCREFYGDGDWASSEDGDEYCRMCGQGGDILLCDKCPNAFRRQCLQRSLGSRALREIQKAEEWNCLVCDPKPLYNLKAIYYCVYKKQEEFKNRREENIKKEKERQAARKARASAPTNKEKEDLVKSPKNFLEENISEAFKTLDVYQKSLETERTRCIKTVKEGMTVEMATSITRKLRKLYAVTQKNMDLLDRAIVESFVENYPTESTRIHMGRVERVDPPTPKKKITKAAKQKIKIKAKNKNKKGAAAGKSKVKVKGKKSGGHIRMNGSPVYREAPFVPSLMKKKRKKEDSDIECIDVSEDDDYRPKKKARPGPASSKKAKPGPASRKAGPKSKTGYY